MTTCTRCQPTPDRPPGAPGATLSLCPEHTLAVLADVRRHLATTLASLERVADRVTRAITLETSP
jgi:hypothetical protein